ncbi:MAG: flagellar hook-associated protein FlgK [Firmicutes bacterium HGW-Firmicutes-14]|nr:MAG: flagellar hook-associated protein FlgK [Firmicutes bacterium HGW-Firmicutes-14]
MRSTFFGLDIGRKALQAQRVSLDVTAHNIANANTEGYTRQRAVMQTTTPFAYPSANRLIGAGQLGTGVSVEEVKRVRDSYIDTQIRHENKTTGYWTSKRDALSKLEVIFNEPSDSGLRGVIDQFWESLQLLSQKPEDGSARSVVRQRASAVTDTFQHMDRQLTELQSDLDDSIEIKIQEINYMATQIRDLNEQIVKIEVSGDNANDLRDKRDTLIDQLSTLVPVDVREDNVGAVTVTIGGRSIVANAIVEPLTAVPNPLNSGYVDIQWSSDNTMVRLDSGSVRGMLDIRDSIIPAYRTKLDQIAENLVNEFNAIHQGGYALDGVTTGQSFFDPAGITAKSISLDAAILTSYDNIAAAANPDAPGDGSNALTLAQLKHTNIPALSGTMDDFYRSLASQLGIDSQEAIRMVENQTLLQNQLKSRWQEISGVSLDEEMTNMIQFQHAYDAAARIVTAMDQMLDTIINRLGIVGR